MLQVWLTCSSWVRRTFLTDACFSLIICQLKLEQFQPPRCRSTTPNSLPLPPPLPPLYFLFTTSLKPQRWNSQSQQGDGLQFPLKHPRLARAHLNQSSKNIIMSSTTRYVFSPWKNALCEIFYLILIVLTLFFNRGISFMPRQSRARRASLLLASWLRSPSSRVSTKSTTPMKLCMYPYTLLFNPSLHISPSLTPFFLSQFRWSPLWKIRRILHQRRLLLRRSPSTRQDDARCSRLVRRVHRRFWVWDNWG